MDGVNVCVFFLQIKVIFYYWQQARDKCRWSERRNEILYFAVNLYLYVTKVRGVKVLSSLVK
jgi:hypothetical protein